MLLRLLRRTCIRNHNVRRPFCTSHPDELTHEEGMQYKSQLTFSDSNIQGPRPNQIKEGARRVSCYQPSPVRC
jgi:hypothetical protein